MLEQMALMRERSADPVAPEVKLRQHIDHCHESHAPVTLTKEKIQVSVCVVGVSVCLCVSVNEILRNISLNQLKCYF